MTAFMDKDFLLDTETARKLYHECGEKLPIVDYHCHLSPKEIAEDKRFNTITELWLGGDHYKWRLMRAYGISEELITGDADDKAKFLAFAEAVEHAIGNPIYHWCHLELQRFFGCDLVLGKDTAEAIYEHCNAQLNDPSFSARGLIQRANVTHLCTTDDPIDSLEYHKAIAEEQAAGSGFTTKVLPAFRPDKAMDLTKPDFAEYIGKLSAVWGHDIRTVEDLMAALTARIEFFDEMGCRTADHGIPGFAPIETDAAALQASLTKALAGETVSPEAAERFRTAILIRLGSIYAAKGWVMQLHFGVIRNLRTRGLKALGVDSGHDAIGDPVKASEMAAVLDAIDKSPEGLPKTILYSLNPTENTMIETVMGCFQEGPTYSKLQHGSAWWHNDHLDGMEQQLRGLASEGQLAGFVGMLTDSRSFLSYARHEYFRRILCRIVGRWVEEGQYPDDEKKLFTIVGGVCYNNVIRYFGFQ